MDSFPAAAAVAPWHNVRSYLMPRGSLNANEHCLFLVNFSAEFTGQRTCSHFLGHFDLRGLA